MNNKIMIALFCTVLSALASIGKAVEKAKEKQPERRWDHFNKYR